MVIDAPAFYQETITNTMEIDRHFLFLRLELFNNRKHQFVISEVEETEEGLVTRRNNELLFIYSIGFYATLSMYFQLTHCL